MDSAPAPAADGPRETANVLKMESMGNKVVNETVAKEETGQPQQTPANDNNVSTEQDEGEADSGDSEPLTLEQAKEKIMEGKRHMKCQEYEKAAECFSHATETFARSYGEEAIECGEVFYYYGDALLQLASTEQTLIGGGGGDDDGQDGDGDDAEGTDVKGDDEVEGESLALVDGNMQLAWEALEVARVIFQQAGKIDELAQVYMKLGEHGQMRDDYKQALEDFHESLRLRESIAQPNDRELAEIRYLLGLCYMYDKQYTEAQGMYRKARDILKANVQANPELAVDLDPVLADLAEKIDECKELQQEKDRAEQETKAAMRSVFMEAFAAQQPASAEAAENPFVAAFGTTSEGSNVAAASTSVPVARDLGSLVRKRKVSAQESEASESVKREKAEEP